MDKSTEWGKQLSLLNTKNEFFIKVHIFTITSIYTSVFTTYAKTNIFCVNAFHKKSGSFKLTNLTIKSSK